MHFPIIVITENVGGTVGNELLAPYYENLGSNPYMELPYPELKDHLDRFCSSELPPYGGELWDALDADDIGELKDKRGFLTRSQNRERREALTIHGQIGIPGDSADRGARS